MRAPWPVALEKMLPHATVYASLTIDSVRNNAGTLVRASAEDTNAPNGARVLSQSPFRFGTYAGTLTLTSAEDADA